jgi:hypothetical protein
MSEIVNSDEPNAEKGRKILRVKTKKGKRPSVKITPEEPIFLPKMKIALRKRLQLDSSEYQQNMQKFFFFLRFWKIINIKNTR